LLVEVSIERIKPFLLLLPLPFFLPPFSHIKLFHQFSSTNTELGDVQENKDKVYIYHYRVNPTLPLLFSSFVLLVPFFHLDQYFSFFI
jgi:hypothetical protein